MVAKFKGSHIVGFIEGARKNLFKIVNGLSYNGLEFTMAKEHLGDVERLAESRHVLVEKDFTKTNND